MSGRYVRTITQDTKGFLWLGTEQGVSRFDGYEFKSTFDGSKADLKLSLSEVWSVAEGDDQSIWVGTNKNGLFRIKGGAVVRYNKQNKSINLPSDSIRVLTSIDDSMVIGTDKGLVVYKNGEFIPKPINFEGSKSITSATKINSQKTIVSTFSDLFEIDNSLSLKKLDIDIPKGEYIRKTFLLNQDELLVVTNTRIYTLELESLILMPSYPELENKSIVSVHQYEGELWFGTIRDGLYKASLKAGSKAEKAELSDDDSQLIITSLLVDHSNTLWLGTFNNGLKYFTSRSDAFTESYINNLECLKSRVVQSFLTFKDELFIGTDKGLFSLKHDGKECKNIVLPENEGSASVWSIKRKGQSIYVTLGKYITELNNGKLKIVGSADSLIYDLLEYDNRFLVGTAGRGLLIFNETESGVQSLSINGSFKTVYQMIQIQDEVYLATDNGLYLLNLNNITETIKITEEFKINSFTHHNGKLYLATNQTRILVYDLSSKELYSKPFNNLDTSVKVEAYLVESDEIIWISTSYGVFRYNIADGTTQRYTSKDGLATNIFSRGSVHKAADDLLLFGARQGIATVNPKKLTHNEVPPKVVLTELRLNNKVVGVEQNHDTEFYLDNPIEYTKSLDIDYRAYLISLKFAALHYADPSLTQYLYKLEGVHEEWIETDSNNRLITLSTLPSGSYLLRIKARSLDGVLSQDQASVNLPITVSPAPWLSWWAYTIYIFTAVLLTVLFIRHRIKSLNERARELETEVEKRTREIKTQKSVIESLLDRKNELFANISHEFRTPLTLVLGPLEKEMQELSKPKNPRNFEIIKRNAHRLLGMVEQILKLSELNKEGSVSKVARDIRPILEEVVNSFYPLADISNIKLESSLDANCSVLLIDDALEVIVGNLISNALKYTESGGSVFVNAMVEGSQLKVTVQDTGVGIDSRYLNQVFERFQRINETSDIAGSGIGLSIVKELVIAHGGRISVESEKNVGTIFTLTLETTNQLQVNRQYRKESINHLTNTSSYTVVERLTEVESGQQVVHEEAISILIVDDNPDMRAYIADSLGDGYGFEFASRGEEALEIATEAVPDLVICDVMMPGISGFDVARKLRDQEVTSHIPILLLTAKGDKDSRIQGWNENIDGYMTKPFDVLELRTRVDNILAIRAILRKKVGAVLQITPGSLQPPNYQDSFNKRDKEFLDKLNLSMQSNYSNPQYGRSQMASAIALSERQFQRKLKSLTDKAPSEMLREYRLNKAAEFLANGDPASLVADKCGFSSSSHFSVAFKAFFDTTPSLYQKSNKKIK